MPATIKYACQARHSRICDNTRFEHGIAPMVSGNALVAAFDRDMQESQRLSVLVVLQLARQGPDIEMRPGMSMPRMQGNLLVARFAYLLTFRHLGTPFPGNRIEVGSTYGQRRFVAAGRTEGSFQSGDFGTWDHLKSKLQSSRHRRVPALSRPNQLALWVGSPKDPRRGLWPVGGFPNGVHEWNFRCRQGLAKG